MKYIILFLIPILWIGFTYLTMSGEIKHDLKAGKKESLKDMFMLGGVVSAGSMVAYTLNYII